MPRERHLLFIVMNECASSAYACIHLLYDLYHITAFLCAGHYGLVVMQYVHYILYHFIVVAHRPLVQPIVVRLG